MRYLVPADGPSKVAGYALLGWDPPGSGQQRHEGTGQPQFGRFGWEPASARFRDRFTEDLVNVLIDHILVSQDLALVANDPHRVWNPFQDDVARPMRDDLRTASDHFPVTIDLNIP